MYVTYIATTSRLRGFTLIEVLIALLVTAAGLLGLAKMQALAISGTKESGGRALISIQAGSLASMMQANKAYWAAGDAPAIFTISGIVVTDTSGDLTSPPDPDCKKTSATDTATVCTPAQLAAQDVHDWAVDMANQFPSYSAKVNCTTDVALPISCVINLTWAEKIVSINKGNSSGASGQQSIQSFSIYVKP